ncbi:MAG TPA: glycine cleavage T C-terminal barrel domain-containing protein [Bryobacteraceae bacterium]|nr:glycine cleavage T C-terminal barrel domain-containing protein [Bryobacteraceae bacterium]
MSAGYDALRSSAAWLDLSARGRILAKGRDRARLLHNITSNEVKKMTPGTGNYAFLLSPQGRIQADLYLFCFADHFLMDTEPEYREKVQQHILKYKVADQVELENITESTAAIGIEGPNAASMLMALGAPVPESSYAHLSWGELTVAAISETGQPGFRIYSPIEARPSIISQLEGAGATLADADDARLVRMENGKPVYGIDIRDTSLPQETQQMHALSFSKGCYLGQEIVERIRAMGRVHRKLERVELEGRELPDPGTKLTVDGREAEITSSVYSPHLGKVVALAYVRV